MEKFSDRQILLGLILVAGLAIFGGRPRLMRWRRLTGLEQLLASRFHYLLAGMVLAGVGVMTSAVVHELDALVTLGLGVIGLLLGLRLRGDALGDRRLLGAAAIESLTTLFLVGVPLFFMLEVAGTLQWRPRAAAAALIGCSAAISGRIRASKGEHGSGSLLHAIGEIADLGTVIAVLAAGVLLALLRARLGIPPLERVLVLLAVGTVGGLGAWLLGTGTSPGALRTTVLLGILLVTAGTASHLALPPVAATLLMGMTIANLPGELAEELSAGLAFLDRPLQVLLLVIAGAALPSVTWAAVAVLALFLALRTAGKILGGRMASIAASDVLPQKMGLGLLSSSAVALGLALDYQATAPPEVASMVVTTAVLGMLFSETAAVWTTRLLERAHVISSAALTVVSLPPAEAPAEEQAS